MLDEKFLLVNLIYLRLTIDILTLYPFLLLPSQNTRITFILSPKYNKSSKIILMR